MTMTNPASNIIEKCGGHQAVADMLQVDVSRVYRWTYPRDRGGSDGVIPAKHQMRLLAEAGSRGITLSPNDFFDVPGALTPLPVAPVATPAPIAPEPHSDPAALAAILDQLGGDVVIAEATRAVAVVDLEGMRSQGFIWSQFVKPLVAHARACGFDLDAERLVMRLNKDRGRAA
jgi:hypothetical protein